MPYEPLIDPQFWRDRARGTRAKARRMNDPGNKLTMLKIAEGQKRLAALLERLRDHPAGKPAGHVAANYQRSAERASRS